MFEYLRVLFGQSMEYTCCAGCNTLAAQPDRRFCVSRAFDRPVDLILTHGWDAPATKAALYSLRRFMPWLRRIFIPSTVRGITDDNRVVAPPAAMGEDTLHSAADITEYFITLPRAAREDISGPLLPTDFFTPNGLPLLFAAPGGTAAAPPFVFGPAARTKKLTELFAAEGIPPGDNAASYTLAFARWAYARQHGVLSTVRRGGVPSVIQVGV
jgi:hypothetical protein